MSFPFLRRARHAGLAAVAAAGVTLAACGDSPTASTGTPPTGPPSTLVVPRVGDVLSINTQTNSACNIPSARGGRVVAVSDRAVVVADTANPAGGFTNAEYANIGATFDTLVYPVDVRHFGAPTDIDNNGRVIIFFTRAVNELTPANVQYVIGGFFISRDLFPKTSTATLQGCTGSNQGELFYLLVPDPNGTINSNPRSKDRVLTTSLSTVGHEFQHLINAARRLYVLQTVDYYEQVWLNEGLSHVAEELNFYRVAGLSPAAQPGQSPRSDLGLPTFQTGVPVSALNGYQINNLSRFGAYLKAVADSTPIGLKLADNGDPDDDGLATRGAVWSFLRYASDRIGGTDSSFFYNLVNTRELGLANLRTATGAGAALEDWFRDWAVANYADNYAAPALDTRFQHKSWNYRSILPALSSSNRVYPLDTHALTDGVATTEAIVGGTAVYFPFSVGGGATATVTTRDASGTAPGAAVRVIGWDVDLGSAIAKKLGLTAEFQESKFDSILPALGTRYELGMSSFTDNPVREKVVDFVTYFSAGTQWASKDANFDPDNACGKKVAVQTATVQDTDDLPARQKKCAGNPIQVQRYDGQDEATNAVALGRADAVLADSPIIAGAVKKVGQGLQLVGEVYDAAPYGIAIPKTAGTTKQAVLGAMKALISDGTYKAILDKWGVGEGAITDPVINGAGK